MKLAQSFLLTVLLSSVALAQQQMKSATVPITLDHNRVIVDVYLPLPDGTKTRVRGWLDTGNPDLHMTEQLAKKVGLTISGEPKPALVGKQRTAQAPKEIIVGGMTIPLPGIKDAHVIDQESIGPGCSAQINLPSKVLRNYDVIVDYPNRELTLAVPGNSRWQGNPAKATVTSDNGLVLLPATVAGNKQNAILDLGATVSFFWTDVLTDLQQNHPDWPHMTGAVGPANLWGLDGEPQWDVLRIPQMLYGGTELSNVVVAGFPNEFKELIEKRAGLPSIGLIGANALLNYKVGIDYAHSAVYFQQLSKYTPLGIDVVGLILRPEADEHYTVIGIADFQGHPAVTEVKPGDRLISVDGGRATGATMGQVWSLLEGSPGTIRTLVLEREGKQLTVKAPVREFLPPIKLAATPVAPRRRKAPKGR
jgi:hypothetical protein